MDRDKSSKGANLGSSFGQLVKTLFPDKRIAIIQTSTEQQLTEDLADVFEKHVRADLF